MKFQSPRAGASAATPHINVTPLIDVLLVLLIIFMVISPLRPSRFKALVPEEPPDNPELPIKENSKSLVVIVGHGRQLTLNQTPELGSVDEPARLVAELSRVFSERERNNVVRDDLVGRAEVATGDRIEKTVFIRAPRSINYGEVARVIDAVKGAGANPVGLQIDDLEP
ncbi:MAG: biopolymer transporter ExbD [Pyrinomonadaceae bacterium]